MSLVTLDLETAPRPGCPQEYALQPWRYKEGSAYVTCAGLGMDTGEALLVTKETQYKALLKSLEGKTIHGWNLMFDIAWLIAYGYEEEVRKINWVDAMLLWKWLDNSQFTERGGFSWSLGNAVTHFFKDAPWAVAFVKMKKSEDATAGQNDKYWEQRAKLDCIATSRVAAMIYSKLDEKRTRAAMYTMGQLIPMAGSWVRGVTISFDRIDSIVPTVTREMSEIECRLGVHNEQATHYTMLGTNGWTPSRILRSPKKLAELIYGTWGLTATMFSEKTKAPKTDKAALTYLADDNDLVIELLRWRQLNTQLSKYLQSPLKSREYLGSDVLHPCPKIFGTYTGRSTYTSKTAKKFPTGLALHQIPRDKAYRKLIRPRPGYKHLEIDAASQESRLMACQSGDYSMVKVFADDLDFHSFTGAKVGGISYEQFLEGKAANNKAITGPSGLRYCGKFLNLSQNFRVGVKTMRIQARVQYGLNKDWHTIKGWQDLWQSSYPGVKKYWKDAIYSAKNAGYAETMAGRRFKLIYWGKDHRWGTESSAIMMPIQGSAADMADLAILLMDKHYPEFEVFFTLHDAIHFEIPEDTTDEKIREARTMLNDIDYQKYWGYTPPVPLTYDASVGPCWADLEELD